MKLNRCVLAVASLVACAGAANAQELWRQNPVNSFGGLSAQDARNPGGLGWFSEVVDNFDAQDGWSIGQVEFWGGYATDVPGHTQGFMIRFYTNDAGSVGALQYTADVLTFTEEEYYSTFIPGLGTVRGYHYVCDLPTAFDVPGAGSYWISVTAILDRGGQANEPQWGWIQATTINPPPCMQRFFSPTFTPQGQDVSFVLNAAGAPGCIADFNNSGGTPDDADVAAFFAAWNNGDESADVNGSGGTPDDADISFFFIHWNAGC